MQYVKEKRANDVPTMPLLSQALAPAMCRPEGVGGGSNLPQLKEGQLFAAEIPDRFSGGPLLAHAPVPASRGGGGSKKKASAYDPSNPCVRPFGAAVPCRRQPSRRDLLLLSADFSKPPSKTKSKGSKSSSSHGFDKGGPSTASCGPSTCAAPTSQMGVVGQAHSIAGLGDDELGRNQGVCAC